MDKWKLNKEKPINKERHQNKLLINPYLVCLMPKLRFVITVHTCAGLSFVPMGMLGGWEIRESFAFMKLIASHGMHKCTSMIN